MGTPAVAQSGRLASAPAPLADGGGAVMKDAQVDDCLKLLGGTSDEEKFAGLLLVTKVAQPDDPVVMRRVLEAVGMRFLQRLMTSSGSPNGASDDSSLMYQCMALNVLSSFCALEPLWPDLHTHKDFVRMAPLLVQTLRPTAGVMHPAVDNAVVCLACMAASDAGAGALRKHRGARAVADFLSLPGEDAPERTTRALFVLDALLAPTLHPSATAEALPALAFIVGDTSRKTIRLDVLPILARTMRCRDAAFSAQLLALGTVWHGTVRGACQNLFQNKLPSKIRKHILGLGLAMCEHFGQEWALPPAAAADAFADGTFVQLLVGFSNIELRLRLEEAVKPEDNDEAVPIALAVIEHTLQFLSEGGEAENDGEDEAATVKSEGLRKWVDMDPQRLLQLKRDLDEAVDAMFIYLEDLREAGSLNDTLVLPICRLLGIWFLEVDSEDFRQKLCVTLPVICQTQHAFAGAHTDGGGVQSCPVYFMLPALAHMVTNDDVRRSFLRAKGHITVAQIMATALRLDGERGTDVCLTGALLLVRVLALSPMAVKGSEEAFTTLVLALLPVAKVLGNLVRQARGKGGASSAAPDHLATLLTLVFQIWQGASPSAWQPARDGPVMQGYVSVLTSTLHAWVECDAGALCLMAASGAAAAHADVCSELCNGGVQACLASAAAKAGADGEAVATLLNVLEGDASGEARTAAKARAAAGITEEADAARQEAALRAATRRPEAPPIRDAAAVWQMRAERATREIADIEAKEDHEIDFGGRLQLQEVQAMLSGMSSGSAHDDSEGTRVPLRGANASALKWESSAEALAGSAQAVGEGHADLPRTHKTTASPDGLGGLDDLD